MAKVKVDNEIIAKAEKWLNDPFDKETREQVKAMLENNEELLMDSFYRDLEFGTGGLRGVIGSGTNRMNKYTVGMATQGLANYVKKHFPVKRSIAQLSALIIATKATILQKSQQMSFQPMVSGFFF